jgi:hypothetical protein
MKKLFEDLYITKEKYPEYPAMSGKVEPARFAKEAKKNRRVFPKLRQADYYAPNRARKTQQPQKSLLGKDVCLRKWLVFLILFLIQHTVQK